MLLTHLKGGLWLYELTKLYIKLVYSTDQISTFHFLTKKKIFENWGVWHFFSYLHIGFLNDKCQLTFRIKNLRYSKQLNLEKKTKKKKQQQQQRTV